MGLNISCDEYLENFLKIYSLVGVLSQKNGCRVLRLRHRKKKQDIVLRLFENQITAYETLYKLKCENLPIIYDVIGLCDGQAVIEEYIDGLTLSEIMESGRYRYSGAKKVLKAVCHALDTLHSVGIIHRDIKPENIIVDKKGRVVLIDLNASRKISSAPKDTVIMGTVGYASPEQLGVTQSDARTDIYACGVLLNVMVTGKHPSELIAKGKTGRIVKKCTSVNPDDRYQTALKLSAAL